MINRLLEELKKYLPKAVAPIDPAQWEDSVALKTEWDPLKGGGTNIRTHVLTRRDDGGRCVFRPAAAYIAFCGFFLLIGLGIMIAFIVFLHPREAGQFIPILMGLLFAAVGAGMLAFGARPVIFDKETGTAWRGWRDPRSDFEHGQERSGVLCRLDDIHALQIVSEFIRSSKSSSSSYTSYELNLVMLDGKRLNVVDHGDVAQLRKDAAELGVFLEVPVWDATLIEARIR